MFKNQIVKAFLLVSSLVAGVSLAADQNSNSVENIVNEIKLLEKEKDPKCYATASRLEDFMFGTPLSQQARFNKNLLQKAWVMQIWEESSKLANQQNLSSIPLSLAKQVIERELSYKQNEKGHWAVKFKSGQEVQINKDDKRQYSTIAYALRAILAVQQESLLDFDSELMPIGQDVINEIKSALELVSLSVLKISDAKARKEDSYEVSTSNLEQVWTALIAERSDDKKNNVTSNNSTRRTQNTNLALIRKIIKQKVESYAAYNKISEQLFIRNLQVYFARLSWPKDKSKAKEFQSLYIETMIQFAYDFYKESEKIALKKRP